MKKKHIAIKELASAIGVSEDTVRRRMKDWGLDECVCAAYKKPLLLFREAASDALLERKVISKPL